jgi:site-specific recombinase XerD
MRRKNGRPSVHIIRGDEIRALRRLKREQFPSSPYIFFTSERRGPFTASAVRKIMSAVAAEAAFPFPFPIHPHMLRHACSFVLAHAKHDIRAIQE